jgi:tetratricopeptide (TPR) repeat protein/predicted Ser/Thr protein kinase
MTAIGRYKLLQELGEGGFGVVYQAEQTEPVRRTVALKVIKRGMDTKQVIARFEAERQALAMMDHPNIAKVLDAGATDGGRPYFVMELVKGVPITEYCDQARLDTVERLQLFQDVCHAVQHAHQKGVIHRDLKPNNVLVALHEGRPVVKVIDFGIAKATDHHLTDKTLFTEFRQMIGTPEYMAPEQAELSGLDIDTRADIYSLGVLLYELLTGTKPHDMNTLAQQGFEEILRTIREVDPERPSTRVSTMGEELRTIAQKHHTGPNALGRLLRGDLDWIVMKALEKDRSRRYETASALALDVQRHLDERPIAARPPSAAYRTAKYVRRHRVGVAAASIAFVSLVVGVALSFTGYAEAAERHTRARTSREAAARDQQAADLARASEAGQRAIAEAREKEAKTDAEKATTVLELIQDMLGSANPHEVKGRNYTVRQLLDNFDRDLGDKLTGQPEIEAAIRMTMGTAYRGLGLYDRAEPNLKKALAISRKTLGDGHPNVAAGTTKLAIVLFAKGDYGAAEELHREALAIRLKALGDEHPDVATSRSNLAMVLNAQGDHGDAEKLFGEALRILRKALGDEHPRVAICLNNIAGVHRAKGDYDAAAKLFREAHAILRKALGDEHPRVATSRNNLAAVLESKGNLEAAERLHSEGLAILRKALGDGHPRVATSLNNLATVLKSKGNLDAAQRLHSEALAILREALGDEHPQVAASLNNLASVLKSKGNLEAAERLHREGLAILRKALGDEHHLVARSRSNLLGVLLTKQDYRSAEAVCRDLLERYRSDRGLAVLSMCLLKQNKHAEAEPIARECLAIRAKKMPGHWAHYNTMSMLGASLAGQGKYAEAEPLLVEGYEKMKPPAQVAVRKREALDRVIKLYEDWKKPEKAARYRALISK